MIRLFLYSLLAIITGLLLTLMLAREPGYLLLSFGTYTFETSLFALFVALLFGLVGLRLLLVILDWINPLHLLSFGRSLSAARAERRSRNLPLPLEQAELKVIDEIHALLSTDSGSVLTIGELRKFWKKHASQHADSEHVVAAYVELLERNDLISEAVTVLEGALDRQWHESLVQRYAVLSLRADDATAARQLLHAENWLQTRTRDAGLLLALGRLSLRNRLWGKAKEYFERSLRTRPDAEAFAELARLLQSLREPEKNPDYLRLHTRTMNGALPPFPQP